MKKRSSKMKIGIIGCGAIGKGIAQSIQKQLSSCCVIAGLYDHTTKTLQRLTEELSLEKLACDSLDDVIAKSDCIIEAVNATNTDPIISQALRAKKHVLAMSVGRLLDNDKMFRLAQKNNCRLLLPSGAIAGIDAIKAASLVPIRKLTLTTRKPPQGFLNNAYVQKKNINLENLQKEVTIYKGNVEGAVKNFPRNINVAATLALASEAKDKMTVQIVTSPQFTTNSHEIEAIGDFGRLVTLTENVVCPDNPKTSYLAVLSGIQTLKQFCTGHSVGT